MSNNFPSVFVISLDFELHWGCFESRGLLEQDQLYFQNTRNVIPRKLDLVASEDIHVTWAAVGMLYNRNQEEWQNNKPTEIPAYDNAAVSSYEWINRNGFYSLEDPYHFAPHLINKIKQTPHQEIGTHTYSHYYCLEPGQTAEQFRLDLETACRLAEAQNIQLRSLVFPRNQFNQEYLTICKDMGITAVRSSPAIWYWKPATGSGFWKKFFRAGDAYLPIQPIRPVFLKDIDTRFLPLQLPASRLYRSWQPKYKLQNGFKLRRILNEMTEAARTGAYYHIWWHPHNFGNQPEECMKELEQILQHFRKLKRQFGMLSLNMHELSERLLNRTF